MVTPDGMLCLGAVAFFVGLALLETLRSWWTSVFKIEALGDEWFLVTRMNGKQKRVHWDGYHDYTYGGHDQFGNPEKRKVFCARLTDEHGDLEYDWTQGSLPMLIQQHRERAEHLAAAGPVPLLPGEQPGVPDVLAEMDRLKLALGTPRKKQDTQGS